MLRSEQINELVTALSKAQGAMKNAAMDGENPHFRSRYATLASVLDSVRRPLSDNGLAVTQITEIRGEGLVLVTTLFHSSGQWLSSEFPLPLVEKAQEMGSALTYAKRYQVSAMLFNTADEDDDGNAAPTVKPRKPAADVIAPAKQPHEVLTIPQVVPRDEAQNWIEWGQWFLECYKTSKTSGQAAAWEEDNHLTLGMMEKDAAKVYLRLKDATEKVYIGLLESERGA